MAAASHPPATYQFKRAGMVELVDLPKSKIPSVSAGLWFTQAYIQAHPDIVQAIVDALVEALHREKTDRAYAEAEMTAHLGVKDPAELDFTYDFYINEILAEDPMPDAAQIQGDIDAIVVSNPKVKNLDPAAMLDQTFVKRAIAANAK